jgi:glycosyltransferase involved in cell wall biosynthesis
MNESRQPATNELPLRVAIFLPSLAGGGAERVVVNLLRGLQAEKVNCTLLLAAAEGVYLDQVPEGVEVVDLGVSHVRQAIWPLRRWLSEHQPQLLVSHLSHANIAAALAVRRLSIPTQLLLVEHLTMSAYEGTSLKDHLIRPLARWLYKGNTAVATVSQGAARDLEQQLHLPADSVHVLYNPVVDDALRRQAAEPLDDSWPGQPETPRLIAIGRLTPQKNFPLLLRGFARLVKQHPARLVILGEGEQRSSLETLIEELGLSELVELPGFVSNPYAWLSQADLFVLSSRFEALPTVLIESLACGTPVVATDCPAGPAEILQQGRWGRLVPMDDELALADAMAESLADTADPAALRDRAADFSVEIAVQRYLQLFRQLLTENSPRL